MLDIKGASAIVTGGASGLGAATCRLLAERGAHVVAVDLNEDLGNALAGEIGGKFARADVSDEAQVQAWMASGEVDLAPGSTIGGLGIVTINDLDSIEWSAVQNVPTTIKGFEGVTCSDGDMPAWDALDALWVCVPPAPDSDLLAALNCNPGNVAKIKASGCDLSTTTTVDAGGVEANQNGYLIVGDGQGTANPNLVSAADMELFKEVWAKFDPDANNYIPADDVKALILQMPPPLGRNGVVDAKQVASQLAAKLNLPQVDGEVRFHDLLSALVHFSYFEDPENAATLNLNKEEFLQLRIQEQ